MSAHAYGSVLGKTHHTGTELYVLLALADGANSHSNNEVAITIPDLADMTATSPASVKRALATLTDEGYLTLVEDNSRNGLDNPNHYLLRLPDEVEARKAQPKRETEAG
jgi:CRP-like cAMP-binding protein